MKACFPMVGEKEYKDSSLRTEQRQCVFTKPPCRIRIYLIRVVLVQYPPCERPAANNIRAISEIRVLKKYSCHSDYSCSKPVSAPAANKIRVREIRVQKSRESI